MENSELNLKILDMAKRIKDLRELLGIPVEEMAAVTSSTPEDYLACENGKMDLTFTFIYQCANHFKVNVTDIIEGFSPTLRSYTVTRAGSGQKISQAHGMTYYNLAYSFNNRIAEPLYVRSIFDPQAQDKPIEVTSHEGQECDIVIDGYLMVQVGEHRELLGPGDSIYYNSGTPHGMIAVNGKDCLFYAIVLNPTGEPIPELVDMPVIQDTSVLVKDDKPRIYQEFIDVEESEDGAPPKVTFKNTDSFNFAFDIIDEIAKVTPDKRAMLHIDKHKTERSFTFKDIKNASCRCANYFKSLGIKKGDRVMLVLKRHYEFWFAMLGLEKIGAIAIPATNQLLKHDFEYRFKAAGVSTIICTIDGDTANQAELAFEEYGDIKNKLIVGGEREGWRNFDEEYVLYSSKFERKEDSPCGEDPMMMFFTSGTSGYPKIALHSYKYALGHFYTAKYWHNVNPDGLHLTISDTGWAKAMWGKMFGQWLCEAALFVYDFDRFDSADILPMFARYKITTFCAPPTMLRMMVKEDISKYDLSSVQHMSTAGEALNPEVYRQFEKNTGLQIHEGFGQSETTMVIGNLVGVPHKIGSMGKPVPTYGVALMDADGNLVPPGENGEIVIDIKDGHPCGLFKEYYNNPEENAHAFHDGWYHTGDIAWMDEDGFYWYVGRGDDVIKSSGYRIGPFEIENVIMELPYVLECGVCAAPDPIRGQVVKASIVLVKGTEPTEELKREIQNYVKINTAPYKYPRIVEFRESLPKTTSGKIIRNQL